MHIIMRVWLGKEYELRAVERQGCIAHPLLSPFPDETPVDVYGALFSLPALYSDWQIRRESWWIS